MTVPVRLAGAVGLALLAPPLVAVELLVLNAATLFFPAWIRPAASRADAGMEVMGQRLLFVAATLIVVVVALTPATIVSLLLFWIAQLVGPFALAIGVGLVGALAVLIAEVAAGVWLLGARFEGFDLSKELQPRG